MDVWGYARVSVLLTITALAAALLSLTMCWFEVGEGYVDYLGNVQYLSDEFYPTYFIDASIGMMRYGLHYEEVGDLFDLVMAAMVAWAVLAIVFVAAVVAGARGRVVGRRAGFLLGLFVLGIGMFVPILFATSFVSAFNTDNSSWYGDATSIDSFSGSAGLLTWGPATGWYLAMGAGIVQAVAVLFWNLPMVLHGGRAVDEELSEEEPLSDVLFR